MSLPTNFEFFERKTPNTIEKSIKEHGDDVCRQVIGIDYIRDQLKIYDFGFIHRTPKTTYGRATRKTEYTIYSFVLCKLNMDFSDVDISLVCSRPNSKEGAKMLELVHNHARQLGLSSMSLLAIGNTRLLRWYTSHGFVVQSYKQDRDDPQIKMYYMRKRV
jgi:hypothetical protein